MHKTPPTPPKGEDQHTALNAVVGLYNFEQLMIKELKVEVCDATGVEQGTDAGYIITQHIYKELWITKV